MHQETLVVGHEKEQGCARKQVTQKEYTSLLHDAHLHTGWACGWACWAVGTFFFFLFFFLCFCGLQIGQQPRGLHYKQQIKGLPLIRCQGQKGALPVLAMIQYLLICCAPGWKEISSLTEKSANEYENEGEKEEGSSMGLDIEIEKGMKECKKSFRLFMLCAKRDTEAFLW